MIVAKDYVIPTKEDEQTMSRDELIKGSIPYALSRAKFWWGIHEPRARVVEMDDVVSACMEGLIIAADKFDRDMGFKFISYARFWIDQRAKLCTEADMVVKAPQNRHRDFFTITKHSDSPQLTDAEEVAEKLGWDKTRLDLAMRGHSGPVRGAMEEYYDTDQSEYIPTGANEYDDTQEKIDEMLDTLPERDREIMKRLHYDGETMQEVGDAIGLSRERIRQIKEASYRLLRKRFHRLGEALLATQETHTMRFMGREVM